MFSPSGVSDASIAHKATILDKIHTATHVFRIILAIFLSIILGIVSRLTTIRRLTIGVLLFWGQENIFPGIQFSKRTECSFVYILNLTDFLYILKLDIIRIPVVSVFSTKM